MAWIIGASTNLYGYVQNMPVSLLDPLGTGSITVGGVVGAVAQAAAAVAGVGPDAAMTGFNAASAAQLAQARAGLPDFPQGDAFRHCVWSCMMTQSIGASAAMWLGSVHEAVNILFQNQSSADSNMDIMNNGMGVLLGEKPGNCQIKCIKALCGGRLFGSGGAPMAQQ